MELFLQFGYGMMEHSRQLISAWNGGTVIMSPRDLTGHQLGRLATSITELPSGHVLLDPQFYLPHADHRRLCSHEYWPANFETGAFWSGPPLRELLQSLHDLNGKLGTSAFILPGTHADAVDDDWMAIQQAIQSEACELDAGLPVYATIALGADAIRTDDQVGRLLEHAQEHPANGYYLVFEHPEGQYLSDDPNWLANVLDIVAGLRLLGTEVILGYCNHQMLIAAVANATAICSGTWMNVRSFPPEKFVAAYDEEIRQRAKWYYCPHALSEYKIPFLDFADREGLLDEMTPADELDGGYVSALFAGTLPSTIDFSEQAAFRHYLHALHAQVEAATAKSFNEAVENHKKLLDIAEEILSKLGKVGIKGQQRDFSEIVDVNRAALTRLVSTRGPMLRREWQ